VIEFWKSAPYMLSFMEKYKLKSALVDELDDPRGAATLVELLRDAPGLFLDPGEIERYEAVDPANSRLRALIDQVLEGEGWKRLWMSPTWPQYGLEGPFAGEGAGCATKQLVFSAWKLVPRVIATLVSYELERRVFHACEEDPLNNAEARKRRAPRLRFARAQGRPAGMPVLALLHPSPSLALLGDLTGGSIGADGLPTLGGVLQEIEGRVEAALAPLLADAPDEGAEDDAWYWAAPILLDLREQEEATRLWWEADGLAGEWSRMEADQALDAPEVNDNWADHLAEARTVIDGSRSLGKPPQDLVSTLSRIALAGPGVAALRALWRVLPDTQLHDSTMRSAAGRIAWALRSLFNSPEAMAILRARDSDEPYWKQVLTYGCEGGIAAVLEEYAHVLRDLEGLFDLPAARAAQELADKMQEALSIRASRQEYHELRLDPDNRSGAIERQRLRGHFAMRFGTEKEDQDGQGQRADHVRSAFNSPFWPFVLATTSVGQEGLDFHAYCHSIVHWNLPSNPVDLEQREGRIHRYKGHAIRKNVAQDHGDAERREPSGRDGWEGMFDRALASGTTEDRGLLPYWVYETEGGAHIERRVPALPLSKDRIRQEALRRSLAVYRMVFGQPRQDDLLAFLLERVPEAVILARLDELQINLAPPHASRVE
jgi:hypothetical protein